MTTGFFISFIATGALLISMNRVVDKRSRVKKDSTLLKFQFSDEQKRVRRRTEFGISNSGSSMDEYKDTVRADSYHCIGIEE